jgi:NAD-dependent deacetylase
MQERKNAMMEIPDSLIHAMRGTRHLMMLTGAGVSAESGLATFRTPQTGLWERFRPEDLATPAAFQRDPALVWGWYEWRRMQVMRALPNPGHEAIAALQELLPRATLVTQNVDDLHERAGSHPVIHLHGSILGPFCEICRKPHALPREIPAEPGDGRSIEPPSCANCGGKIRPGVVWFGEPLPRVEWEAAARAATTCDVFFCIGTSSLVQPAASLLDLAVEAGAVTVQVNPNPTGVEGRVSYALREPAGVALPELVARLRKV